MDPYNKDLLLHTKDYVRELRTNDLSSLEKIHGDSRHFTVDEPLGVELRFDLGRLDAQVLLDTHATRENHWDFVRQEQGRFQASNEENASSLSMHVKQDDLKPLDNCNSWPGSVSQVDTQLLIKQDDLKPFDNCESWPGSASQVDTQLFIDVQEDASMIAEAFGGKDESMAGDDRCLTVPSCTHQEEASQLRVESRTELEENAHMDDEPSNGVDACEAVEVSQPSVETPDKGTSEARSSVEFCFNEDQVREESECKVMGGARPGEEPIDEMECQVLENASEEAAGIFQELPLECGKESQLSCKKLKASDDAVLGLLEQTLRQIESASEHVDTHAGLASVAQDSQKMEGGSKTCCLEPKANSKDSYEKLEDEKQSLTSTDHGDSAVKELKGTTQESPEKGAESFNSMVEVIVDIPGNQNAPDPFCVDHEQGSPDVTNMPGVVDLGSEDVIASPNTIPMRENGSETSVNNHLEEFCKEDSAGAVGCCAVETYDEPGRGPGAEAYKEDSAWTNLSTTIDFHEKSGIVEEVEADKIVDEFEADKEDAAGTAGRGVVGPDDMFAKVDDAEAYKEHAAQMVGGSSAVKPQNLSAEADEAEATTEELNDPGAATEKSGVIEQVAAEREVAARDLLHVGEFSCSTPAAPLVQSAEYVCRDGGEEGNTSTHMDAPHGVGMLGVLSDPGLTMITSEPGLAEVLSQDDTRNRLDTSQASVDDNYRLMTSDCNKEGQKLTGENILSGFKHSNDVLAVKASTSGVKVLCNLVEAGSSDERSRQGTPKDIREGSAISTQQPIQDGVSVNMALPDEGALAEMSQLDGGLHVLLDVHKDVASTDLVPKTSSARGPGVADPAVGNTDDTLTKSSGIIKDSTRLLDTNTSSPSLIAETSGSQEPAQTGIPHDTPPQHKASKSKADASMRNNRLKDSARASPLQTRSDEEIKSAGNQGAGRHKTPAKMGVQSKHNELLEGYPSPRKSGSKDALNRKGKKDVSSPMPQEAMASPALLEGIQSLSSTSKSMNSVNARQSSLPDLNVSEMAVPMVLLPSQPFSEPQQVQLRAQILVYGSLIQGAAPEEALMVAAFSNVIEEAGKHMEASGRASWERQWQAAVDRTQCKSSVLKDSARATAVLVPKLPAASAKTSEEVVSSSHGRMPEGQITRGNSLHSRHNGDLGAGISTGKSTQSAPVVVPSVSSISTIPRSIPSLPGDNLTQTGKSRVDSQQTTPCMYLPAPPQGPFLSGTPQWLSPPTFCGPWLPQTQGGLYSVPSAIFNNSQAVVSINQMSEKGTGRRNVPSPSVPVVPTLFAPGAGSFPITPATSAAEMVQSREPMSESRPRKRKKTQSDTSGSPVVTVYTGNQATSFPTLPIVGSVQAGSSMSSPVHMSTINPAESLAMVIATPQVPNTIPQTSPVPLHAKNVPAPGMLNPRVSQPASSTGLEDTNNVPRAGSQLEQAQASAEEAALVAASAIRESEALWSHLRAQKGAGRTSDMEMQLVSSAVAMSTAVSVAKAAAAAAKAAYEAALQAKSSSEGALGLSKLGNASETSRLLQDSEASRSWQVPEGCNSIMEAAKLASKMRLEAASAAKVRAQTFEAIVKAAELATMAVTQIGSVVVMGESIPFNLEMLLDSGPEGFHRYFSADREKNKEQGQVSGKKETPKRKLLEEKDKKSAKKSSGTKKLHEGDQEVVNRKDMAMVFGAEAGAGLLTEFNNQSLEGLLSSAVDMVQQEAPVSDNQIVKESHVEVMSDEKGLRGVWFSATVQNVEGEKVLVLYNDLLSDNGVSPLQEWIQLNGSPSKAPRVRLAHPNKTIGFEGTRKRRREALCSHKWSVGDRADAWIRDGWWEGEIREIIEDGESKAKVFFPGDGDTALVKLTKLRPSLVWKDGQWVLWTADAMGGKNEPKLRADKSETPVAKRQKTDKHRASGTSKQKITGAGNPATGTRCKDDNNVSDNPLVKLAKEIKGFTVDGRDRTKQQGPKAVPGVPKPTKKRKLIEVSKHFSTGRGARSVDPLNSKACGTGKDEDAGIATIGSAMGSIEAKKSDGSNAKKKVAFGQKAKPLQKGTTAPETGPVKPSGVSTRKDKLTPASKAPGCKDTPIKGAVPTISRNSEGKFVKKKPATSDVGQSEPPQEQSGEVVPTGDAVLRVATGSENAAPVMVEEGRTKPLNTAVARDRANLASESKQTSLSSRKEAAPGSGSVKESKKLAHPSKEIQKQCLNEAKESQSHLIKGSESQLTDSKVVNEKQPSGPPKENKEKQERPSAKDTDKGKDAGKPGLEGWEPRRTSRKMQPTSKLLEGLQTAPKFGKSSSSHDRGSRAASKAPS